MSLSFFLFPSITLKFMRIFAALISSLPISPPVFFRFGTTLAQKKDGRAFFDGYFDCILVCKLFWTF
jgi:hypothetical protein